jgi:signal transduction histidine kinase
VTSVGWLSASILHDLRNPLGTICAGAELLMNLDSASPQAKRLVRNVCRAALTDAENANRTSQPCAEQRIGVRDLRHPARHFCSIGSGIGGDGTPGRSDFAGRARRDRFPLVRSQIERVFFNLIANSFEAMPGGGSVRIRARKTSTYVHIELEDSGPGILGSISDRLFEPFVTSGKQDGLGLGLALARQTVRNHGGDMWIEQAAGARFVIGLPLDHTYCVLGPTASSHNAGNPIAA